LNTIYAGAARFCVAVSLRFFAIPAPQVRIAIQPKNLHQPGDPGSRPETNNRLNATRNMKKVTLGPAILIAVALALSSCVSVPVIARTRTGEKFVGSATASLVSGTFELTSARGLRCWGTYNQWDPAASLVLRFHLSDGRSGTGLIARDALRTSGIGTGVANDGEQFDFWMGDAIAWHVRSAW
jgi:hypothetical protein